MTDRKNLNSNSDENSGDSTGRENLGGEDVRENVEFGGDGRQVKPGDAQYYLPSRPVRPNDDDGGKKK